jgi:hypothetical protein
MPLTASMEAPLCKHAADLKRLDGQRVRLVGTYLPVPTLKKMPRPGQPRAEVYLGEVVIQLGGQAAAYDPTAPENTPAKISLGTTLRSSDEIARFRDRRVLVEGRLVLSHAPDHAPDTASPKPAPTLIEPAGLRPAE